MHRYRLFLPGLLGIVCSMLPSHAWAYSLSSGWNRAICNIVSCRAPGAGGAIGLQLYSKAIVFPALELLFVGLLAIMLFSYGVQLVFRSSEESVISESKAAYTYAITGAAIVSFAGFFANTFDLVGRSGVVINMTPAEQAFNNVFIFLKMLLGAALTANAVLQAFRLITSEGNDELIGRARKRFLAGFVGVAIVLLANSIILGIDPDLGANPNVIATEIVGVANFLLALVAIAGISGLIVCGLLLVVSVDEQLQERAKKISRTTLIALTIIVMSYALVNTFISNFPRN